MAKQMTVSVNTKFADGSPAEKVDFQVERPTTMAEAAELGYTEAEVIDLANRDENSNVGNAARAAYVSTLAAFAPSKEQLEGKSDEEVKAMLAEATEVQKRHLEEAKAAALEAARAYEAGEKQAKVGKGRLEKAKAALMDAFLSDDRERQEAARTLAKELKGKSEAEANEGILAWANNSGVFEKK